MTRSTPRARSGGGLVLLLAALTSVGPFTIDTIFPAFDAIAADYRVDAVAVQQTISVYLVTFAVMSLFHGPLSDALGRRPVIIGGSVAYAATAAGCALAPSLPLLLVARGAQGLVAGAGLIVARTVVRDVFDGEQAQRAMSHMSMIFGLAPAAAPIAGGLILGVAHWKWVFWFLALLGLVLGGLAALFLPETHPADLRTPLRPGAIVAAIVDSTRDAGVRRLVAISSLNFAALFTYIAAAPMIVTDFLGLGPGDFGTLFVPVVVAMITGSWLTGRLASRISGNQFIALGFGLATVGGVAAFVADLTIGARLPWALIGPVATGMGMALVFPIVTLALLDRSPTHRGTLSSLQSFASTLLNAVVSGALVPVVARHPVSLTLTSLGFTLLAWGSWLLHRRRSPVELVTPPHPENLEPTDRM